METLRAAESVFGNLEKACRCWPPADHALATGSVRLARRTSLRPAFCRDCARRKRPRQAFERRPGRAGGFLARKARRPESVSATVEPRHVIGRRKTAPERCLRHG